MGLKTFKSLLGELYIPAKDETLGVDRKDLPQIDTKDTKHFIQHLKQKGVTVSSHIMDPTGLTPTQHHFNKDKIKSIIDTMKSNEYDAKPIIVSNDHCVMDGHHRWIAHANMNKDIAVTKVNLPADKLLDTMHRYPRSYTEKLYESLDQMNESVCMPISAAHMKAFEQFVDKMFEKYKIDFNFTTHFRERLSDPRNNPCITLKDLADTIKKLYEKYKHGEKSLSKYTDTEVVLKDIQNDLNLPIAISYNRKTDDLDVAAKTIMRKKNFKTPDQELKV